TEPAGGGQGALVAAALSHTLDRLAPLVPHVFILRQAPEIAQYSAGSAAQALAYGRLDADEVRLQLGTTPRAALEARFAAADAALGAAAGREGVAVIDLWRDLCTPQACTAYLNGRPVYFDNNHVTNTGALALRARFAPVFGGS
ncbi:SGNH hydrolase domain-containing protein, partial [Rhodovulum sp.]|uniref:SGNH hydrolase domain-containing protein n=1 Tax=Rhodovulum sp. TaxID=34009 RepID=UPI00257D1C3D